MLVRVLIALVTLAFSDPMDQKKCAHLIVSKLDQRFECIEHAAKWKWNYGMKVRDDARRQSLHYLILKVARAKGYERGWNDDVIDLILVQSERYQKNLYYNWRREGISLFPKPLDLRKKTDPQLDIITEELIDIVNRNRDLLQSPGMLAQMLIYCNKLPDPRKFYIAPILGYLAPGRRPSHRHLKVKCTTDQEIRESDRIDSL